METHACVSGYTHAHVVKDRETEKEMNKELELIISPPPFSLTHTYGRSIRYFLPTYSRFHQSQAIYFNMFIYFNLFRLFISSSK